MDAFQLSNCRKENRWICIQGKLVEKDLVVAIVLVYGSNNREGMIGVWEKLKELKQEVDWPLMVLGDLNEFLNPEEKRAAQTYQPE